uniref:Uncharacterized protein n=1 Tax=Anguilla anguilla TaxID=7936 RepID=A0A0E9UUF5_ANGAN
MLFSVSLIQTLEVAEVCIHKMAPLSHPE